MDINQEIIQIKYVPTQKIAGKRKAENSVDDSESGVKKTKLLTAQDTPPKAAIEVPAGSSNTFTNVNIGTGTKNTAIKINVHQSPKKRIELPSAINTEQKQVKEKFIYGNYNKYYGYRNKDSKYHDIRLEVFATRSDMFQNKQVLDIGCNSGLITMEVAKLFKIKSIVGLDIDRSLINQANKMLLRQKKMLPIENEARRLHKYPYNVSFVHGNYVLRDDILLEIEHEQFDIILCMSITKWIHLNFGDAGLKQAFRRMFLQLRSGGKLILEAQPYDNYGRRKKMTETIYTNFKAMQFFPKHFNDFLLSADVGFESFELMGVPENCIKGFKRPIQIFHKT
ncbi:probable RNA methyltransferase CG1239 [Bactrocera neohumeralis]|uniref:probable RNA methyltransferase CG1239 n=1 Tax=Bactrocera neohumeralis TaxID=98809 RepID=UPI002165DC00|nr:probable RNA methyltransferase CG1239 [Bactrocera neohumeralis]